MARFSPRFITLPFFSILFGISFSSFCSPSAAASPDAPVIPDTVRSRFAQKQGVGQVIAMLDLSRQYANADSALSSDIYQLAKKSVENSKNNRVQLEGLYQLGYWHIERMEASDATRYFRNSLKLAVGARNTEYQVKNLIMLTDVKYKQQKFDSASFYIDQATGIVNQQEFTANLASIYNYKALISEQKGNRLDAIDFYLKSARIFEALGNEKDLASVYNNIGDMDLSLGNYAQAAHYFRMSEKLHRKNNMEDRLILNYNNLGIVYRNLDSLPGALEWYRKSIHFARKMADEPQLARSFMNLANTYALLGNFKLAELYYDSSDYFCRKNNIGYGILLNKLNKGEIFISNGSVQRGMKLLLEARELLPDYASPGLTSELDRLFSLACEKKSDYRQALEYYKNYDRLKDSIATVETKGHIFELNSRYERDKSAREIAGLQENITAQKATNRFNILGLAFIILLLAITGLLLLMRRRAAIFKAKLAIEENEKLQLQMELKDKELVGNAMQTVKTSEMVVEVNQQLLTILPRMKREDQVILKEAMEQLKKHVPDMAWKEFETRFSQVHEGFYESLMRNYPDLTPSEIKIAGFLKLNLTTKEISILTNRSSRTIENARSSIRKKMRLDTDDNLITHLLNLR